MTVFVSHSLGNGEDPETVCILLETQFPQMRDKVSMAWIEEMGKGFEGLGVEEGEGSEGERG